MRVLCLTFPRLGIQVARRRDDALASRPLVVLSGEGDSALVSAASTEAAACGVTVGMLASVARGRCPAASFLADNAGECLDVLEQAASILRLRATPSVAAAGREHLFIDLTGMESRFASEALAASRLSSIVSAWTGYDVRAGVAPTGQAALAAARTARRFPVIVRESADDGAGNEPIVATAAAMSGAFAWDLAPRPMEVRARIVRLLNGLQSVLEARHESFRELVLDLHHASGAAATVRLQSPRPLHRSAEAIQLFGGELPDEVLDGVSGIRISLGRLGPDVRVEPARREIRSGTLIYAPVRPVQQRLLRAG
jgi:impB/mucB/samB family